MDKVFLNVYDYLGDQITLSQAQPGANNLQDKLNQLLPSLYIMLATIGAFLILMIFLVKFFYKPVMKMLEKRKKFIQNNIDESIKTKEEAIQFKNQAFAELEDVRQQINSLIIKSKLDQEKIRKNSIEKTKNQTNHMLEEANQIIEKQKNELYKQYHEEVIETAVEISKKIIDDNVDAKKASQYLSEYLKAD